MEPAAATLVTLASLGAAAAAFRAFLLEPTRVELSEHSLPVPGLPPAWEGRCLVHLSDLHYGDPRSERLFRYAVETVNAVEPDVVAITGDFIMRRAREVAPCARHLAGLRSRFGVLGVLGDHDFDRSRRPVTGLCAALQEAGVRLLRNDAVELPGGLRIAGVEPMTSRVHRADLRRAVQQLAAGPHLLLSHSPDIIRHAAIRDVPVILAGHTHGGQVVLPFFGPPVTHTRVARRFASGWSRAAETRMYTVRGLASHLSLRFLCPPEIAVFTMRVAAPAGSGPAGEPGSRVPAHQAAGSA